MLKDLTGRKEKSGSVNSAGVTQNVSQLYASMQNSAACTKCCTRVKAHQLQGRKKVHLIVSSKGAGMQARRYATGVVEGHVLAMPRERPISSTCDPQSVHILSVHTASCNLKWLGVWAQSKEHSGSSVALPLKISCYSASMQFIQAASMHPALTRRVPSLQP